MNSIEITKQSGVKQWWNPTLITIATFILGQLVLGPVLLPLFSSSGDYLPGLYAFIGALTIIILINKFYNKRPITALGFHKAGWFAKYVQGVLLGVIMLGFVVGISSVFGIVQLNLNTNIDWTFILLAMVGFMIQGLTEEVLVRGYLQNSLAATKGFWFSMIVQAVVFTAVHAANPGITFMPVLNLFVVAIMFGVLFWYTDSMWFVGGMHFAWNFILGPVIGIPVSGTVLPSTVFTATVNGSELFTGGSFGIEASILTTLFAVGLSAIVYALIKKKEK